jgi:hypothetical protein
MTATLHPSEIQFNCPPWCDRTREDHLEDLGNHNGCCIHTSVDWQGQGWAVALSSLTYPDGTLAEDEATQVEVDASSCHMTPQEARTLVRAILEAVAEAERTTALA